MKNLFLFTCLVLSMVLSACKPEPTEAPILQPAQIANPASVNCEEKGGKLVTKNRGDLGEYAICVFETGRACEEWALFRGECPETGVDYASYATTAAQFCVLTGNTYQSTAYPGTDQEQGTCTFPSGITCGAEEFYNGACSPYPE